MNNSRDYVNSRFAKPQGYKLFSYLPEPTPSSSVFVYPFISPSATPSVTPSATPSSTPSVTPSSTPSVTPSITPSSPVNEIACDGTASFSGGQSMPSTNTVNLGTNLGDVLFEYNAQNVPDRFVVYFDGQVVIDTGYRGLSSYNDELANLGHPPVSGPGNGFEVFSKTTTTPYATVEVYGPLQNTVWSFTMGCPGTGTPYTNIIPNSNISDIDDPFNLSV